MIPQNFRSYHLAVSLYRSRRGIRTSAKGSPADRRRYYLIALGSLREVQAILELTPSAPEAKIALADQVGGSVYRLCHPRPA